MHVRGPFAYALPAVLTQRKDSESIEGPVSFPAASSRHQLSEGGGATPALDRGSLSA